MKWALTSCNFIRFCSWRTHSSKISFLTFLCKVETTRNSKTSENIGKRPRSADPEATRSAKFGWNDAAARYNRVSRGQYYASIYTREKSQSSTIMYSRNGRLSNCHLFALVQLTSPVDESTSIFKPSRSSSSRMQRELPNGAETKRGFNGVGIPRRR